MSEDKQKLGRALHGRERRLVQGVLRDMPGQAQAPLPPPPPKALSRRLPESSAPDDRNESMAPPDAAPGDDPNESLVEETAASQGAAVLFGEKDGFISALAITLVPKELKDRSRRIAAITQPFGFVCQLKRGERFAVVVPIGYVTDFASIPKFAQGFISPFGKHAEAAVIHDWLYALGTTGDRSGRRRADKTFAIALRMLDVGWFTRWIMYSAVRVGGGKGYGLPGDFAFREPVNLDIVDPEPPRESFYRTIATLVEPKSKGRGPSTAQV